MNAKGAKWTLPSDGRSATRLTCNTPQQLVVFHDQKDVIEGGNALVGQQQLTNACTDKESTLYEIYWAQSFPQISSPSWIYLWDQDQLTQLQFRAVWWHTGGIGFCLRLWDNCRCSLIVQLVWRQVDSRIKWGTNHRFVVSAARMANVNACHQISSSRIVDAIKQIQVMGQPLNQPFYTHDHFLREQWASNEDPHLDIAVWWQH